MEDQKIKQLEETIKTLLEREAEWERTCEELTGESTPEGLARYIKERSCE
ncbi:TPA: hypothetical protein ACX6NV_000587 [Photobacterium damselae]